MGVFDFLFGGKAQKVDWKQLERLMNLSADLNRYNTEGLFGGSQWTEGPDGRWTQTRTLLPGMEQGRDRLISKFAGGEGLQPAMQTPDQFKSLLDAKMANQMARHGLLEQPPALQQENYGTRWGDQLAGILGRSPVNQPPPEAQERVAQELMASQQAPPQQRPAGWDMFQRLTQGQQRMA